MITEWLSFILAVAVALCLFVTDIYRSHRDRESLRKIDHDISVIRKVGERRVDWKRVEERLPRSKYKGA